MPPCWPSAANSCCGTPLWRHRADRLQLAALSLSPVGCPPEPLWEQVRSKQVRSKIVEPRHLLRLHVYVIPCPYCTSTLVADASFEMPTSPAQLENTPSTPVSRTQYFVRCGRGASSPACCTYESCAACASPIPSMLYLVRPIACLHAVAADVPVGQHAHMAAAAYAFPTPLMVYLVRPITCLHAGAAAVQVQVRQNAGRGGAAAACTFSFGI